jgi:hypothetical protein
MLEARLHFLAGLGFVSSVKHLDWQWVSLDRLCGLVVRVIGYRSGGPGLIPGTTRFSEKENSSESGTGSTQPREYN